MKTILFTVFAASVITGFVISQIPQTQQPKQLACHAVPCDPAIIVADNKKKSEIDKMDFNDEKLVDPNLSPDQGSIMARQAPVRTVLVRPRTSFIAELLKTIEDI